MQNSVLNNLKMYHIQRHEKRTIYLRRRFWNFLHLSQKLPLRSSRDVG